ncbi:MAG TPA: FGGY family carbohydrate kinase [Negativicutes bacterium]|nr:FGGY family carbohydrate kinase [Negativicutes bacterium]
MTKVITEKDMLQHSGGQTAIFPSGTLLTPAAKDVAAKNNIAVIIGEPDETVEKRELLEHMIQAVLKNADKTGDLLTRKENVDEELFRRFGPEEASGKLPKLRKTTDIAGYITGKAAAETGLCEGTPVTGGVFDCIACALGSGVYSDDKYSIIAGTWNINSGI